MHLVFAAILALTQHWLLVSDLHVNPFAGGTAPSGYHDDSNWALFDSTLAQMRKAAPDARVVVISGDFLAHHWETKAAHARPDETPAAAALQTMSRIERSFANAFPKAQFVITMGNNDDPCGDYRASVNSPYLSSLARIWAPLVNRGGAAPDFVRTFSQQGSYVAKLPIAGMRAIALDDVSWSIFYRPCAGSRGNPPRAQLAWLSNALAGVPQGTRSILVMHIPPGVDPTSTLIAHRLVIVPFLNDGMRAAFLQTLAANRANIAFALAGHMHRGGFRIAGGVPLVLAPSISPVYANNPAFLRLDVDDRGTLRDSAEYAYSVPGGTWSQIATFDRVYGASGLTAADLAAAHRRIGEDPQVRERWAYAMVGGAGNEPQILRSWRSFWCAQTGYGADYAACAGDRRRLAVLPVALALLAAAVVLVIGGLALLLARQRRAR